MKMPPIVDVTVAGQNPLKKRLIRALSIRDSIEWTNTSEPVLYVYRKPISFGSGSKIC